MQSTATLFFFNQFIFSATRPHAGDKFRDQTQKCPEQDWYYEK